jgi:hypothetical protein
MAARDMRRGWRGDRPWARGCVRRITRSIGNWGRSCLIVRSGRRGGGRGGKGAVEGVYGKEAWAFGWLGSRGFFFAWGRVYIASRSGVVLLEKKI